MILMTEPVQSLNVEFLEQQSHFPDFGVLIWAILASLHPKTKIKLRLGTMEYHFSLNCEHFPEFSKMQKKMMATSGRCARSIDRHPAAQPAPVSEGRFVAAVSGQTRSPPSSSFPTPSQAAAWSPSCRVPRSRPHPAQSAAAPPPPLAPSALREASCLPAGSTGQLSECCIQGV